MPGLKKGKMVYYDLINTTLSSVESVTTEIDEKLAGQLACEAKYRSKTESTLINGMLSFGAGAV